LFFHLLSRCLLPRRALSSSLFPLISIPFRRCPAPRDRHYSRSSQDSKDPKKLTFISLSFQKKKKKTQPPPPPQDKFWTDGRIKGMVKNHFSTLLNRRNVFSGLQWKDDPAIFGFNLFNEPR